MAGLIGGGKSKNKSSSGAGIPNFLEQFSSANPFLQQFFQQASEASRTGGIGAQNPQIVQTIEQMRRAASLSGRQTEEGLQRSGLAGTGFGQQTLASQNLQSNLAIGRAPVDFASQFSNPQVASGVFQPILGALAAKAKSSGSSGPFSA